MQLVLPVEHPGGECAGDKQTEMQETTEADEGFERHGVAPITVNMLDATDRPHERDHHAGHEKRMKQHRQGGGDAGKGEEAAGAAAQECRPKGDRSTNRPSAWSRK